MIRTIINIDKEKCNGCGLCVSACHEAPSQWWTEKRTDTGRLLRGLGNCLPVCPTGAITFEEREAAAFDEAAVEET
jgi:ferredoxin